MLRGSSIFFVKVNNLHPLEVEIMRMLRGSSIFFVKVNVRTRFDVSPKREWIQAHVAQTMNL